ncbi:MAG: rhodanese-like domain-containing protein [Candidatus Gracilibacteria bacterium]
MIHQLPALEYATFLEKHPDAIVIDVRTSEERELVNIGGVHIPLHLLPLKIDVFPRNTPLVLYCHHGIRSIQACEYLDENGFTEIYNLEGGIDRFSQEADLGVERY